MTDSAMTFETKQKPWWLILMSGVFNITIAILLFTVPAKTVFTLVVILGLYWIVTGIFMLVGMFTDRSAWGWKLLVGLLSIAAGVYILRYPLLSTVSIPQIIVLIMGIQGFITGIITLTLAFKGGGLGTGIMGGLSLLFGFVLMANYWKPGSAVVLVWLVAIFSLVGGIVQLVQARQQQKD